MILAVTELNDNIGWYHIRSNVQRLLFHRRIIVLISSTILFTSGFLVEGIEKPVKYAFKC